MFRSIAVAVMAAMTPMGGLGFLGADPSSVEGAAVSIADTSAEVCVDVATQSMSHIFSAGPISMDVLDDVRSANGTDASYCSTKGSDTQPCSVDSDDDDFKCSTSTGNQASCSTKVSSGSDGGSAGFMCSASGSGADQRECSTHSWASKGPKCSVIAGNGQCSVTHTSDVGTNKCSVFGISSNAKCSVFKDAGTPNAECTTFGAIDRDAGHCSAGELPSGVTAKCSAMNADGTQFEGPVNGRCRASSADEVPVF